MFCKEYMIDLNATAAYKRVGYKATGNSAEVNASKLLSSPKVASRIRELKDARADELELDAYWVLRRLKDVSDRSMQAQPVMVFDPVTRLMIESGEYEFDSQGANRSTELIGRHIGMFDPKLELQKQIMKAQADKIKAETLNLTGEGETDSVNDWITAMGELDE